MDAFDTLGLSPTFTLDARELEQRYRDLQRALHPDRFAQAPASERRQSLARAVSVNEAYRALRDPLRRAEILLARGGVDVSEASRREQDPALLMEMMELREQLAEAKAERDRETHARLAAAVRAAEADTTATLAAALSELAADASRSRGEDAARALSRLRYYRRFLDEVAAVEEALEHPAHD